MAAGGALMAGGLGAGALRPAIDMVADPGGAAMVALVPRGRLITIEGLDGAGKTTVVAGVAQELRAGGVDLCDLREPGGVDLSERIREVLADPALRIGGRAEALLYAAARAQLVEEEVEPRLARGTWVLIDRFVDSSIAYQGIGRALGVEAVGTVNAFATRSLAPDRTVLLRVDPGTGRARLSSEGREPDRLEREDEAFFSAVAAAYDELADAQPTRIRVVDASRPTGEVLAAVLAELADLLPPGPASGERSAASAEPFAAVPGRLAEGPPS